MAINLFQREKAQRGLFAVEKAGLIYGIITTLLIFCFYNKLNDPLLMLGERAGILLMMVILYFGYRAYPCRLTTFTRVGAQMGLLAYWYPDTYEFNRLFPNLDHLFAEAEQSIFHCQPSLLMNQVLPQWSSELFNMGYFSYYPLIALVVMFYFFFRYKNFKKIAFIIICSFFIYYAIYICLPVAGPQYYFQAIGLDQAAAGHFPNIGHYFLSHSELLPSPGDHGGFFFHLVENSQAAGERPTAAFPSSHVGISTILMIIAYKGKKGLFWSMVPFYIFLCGATVYIQAHYLIDVIAGFISAIIIYFLSLEIYERWLLPSDYCKGEKPTF